MDLAKKPLVAVLDASKDLINMLTETLEMEGYDTVSHYVFKFRRGDKDILSFLNEHKPQVIVYDIAIPYMENWQFFKHVREIVGNDCKFILVTTNKKVLDDLVGEERGSLEIMGKPFDFDAFLEAVKTSVDQCR